LQARCREAGVHLGSVDEVISQSESENVGFFATMRQTLTETTRCISLSLPMASPLP
jgi:hypothetical protein